MKFIPKRRFTYCLILLVAGICIGFGTANLLEAKKQDKDPWWYMEVAEKMGEPFDSDGVDIELTYSADGRQAYFPSTRGAGGDFDIYMTEYIDGEWTEAVALGDGVNRPESNDLEPQISRNGKILYFTSYNRIGGLGSGDLMISRLGDDGVWGDAVSWNEVDELPNLNNAGENHCPIFAADGLIYFSGDIPGHQDDNGSSDVWKVEKVNGVWQTPENLGPGINSPLYRDHLHWTGLSRDGNSMLIVSERPIGVNGSKGGSDMFISRMDKDGVWGNLENLGDLVNTTAPEICWTFNVTGEIFHGSSIKGDDTSIDMYWVYTRNVPLLEGFHGHGYHP